MLPENFSLGMIVRLQFKLTLRVTNFQEIINWEEEGGKRCKTYQWIKLVNPEYLLKIAFIEMVHCMKTDRKIRAISRRR